MRFQASRVFDLGLVLVGKISTLAVVFVGGVIVAHVGGPKEYALFSVAMSAILLTDGMIGSPLDMAAVRFSALHADDQARSQRFQSMAAHLKLLLAGVAFLVGWFFLQVQAQGDGGSASFPLTACFIATFALLLARSVMTALQIEQRFRIYSTIDMTQGLLRIGGFAVLGFLHVAVAAWFIGVYGAMALGVAVFGVVRLRQNFFFERWPDRAAVREMLVYCGFSAGLIALGTLTGRGDLFFLAAVKGAGNTSDYALASQVAMLLSQVSMYASVVTQPRIIHLHKEGKLRGFFKGNLVVVLVLALVAAALVTNNFLPWFLSLIFPKSYQASVPLLEILLVGTFLDLLVVPVLMIFAIQVCPAKAFAGECVISTLFLTAGLTLTGGWWHQDPERVMAWTAVGVRIAKLLLYAGLFLRHTTPAPAIPIRQALSDS